MFGLHKVYVGNMKKIRGMSQQRVINIKKENREKINRKIGKFWGSEEKKCKKIGHKTIFI